jgi:hypothetical protein
VEVVVTILITALTRLVVRVVLAAAEPVVQQGKMDPRFKLLRVQQTPVEAGEGEVITKTEH